MWFVRRRLGFRGLLQAGSIQVPYIRYRVFIDLCLHLECIVADCSNNGGMNATRQVVSWATKSAPSNARRTDDVGIYPQHSRVGDSFSVSDGAVNVPQSGSMFICFSQTSDNGYFGALLAGYEMALAQAQICQVKPRPCTNQDLLIFFYSVLPGARNTAPLRVIS